MQEMDLPMILLDLAIILFSTKMLGMLMRKIGLPQVVGALIAGILIGPAIWGNIGSGWAPVKPDGFNGDFLTALAEIGVIMMLFSAGLETDLKELKRSGLVSTVVAAAGVIVPLGLGFLIAVPFLGGGFNQLDTEKVLSCVFIGVILTATSVGITVETLKEMGKLKGKVGTCILSAAIIDDVIGILVLTVVISFKDPNTNILRVVISTLLFFVFAIGAGIGINYLFRFLAKKYPNKRRVPIFSLVVCFFYAFAAEKLFGIADITGAYIAGIMLSNIKETEYIDKKVDINSYMIFSPVFFANIGIRTDFSNFSLDVLWFALAFVAVGIAGKILGCGAAAKACKFSLNDSAKIGVGMIARGEVALVVVTKGIEAQLLAPSYVTAVILLVIVSSLLAPVLLKLLYKRDRSEPLSPENAAIEESVSDLG